MKSEQLFLDILHPFTLLVELVMSRSFLFYIIYFVILYFLFKYFKEKFKEGWERFSVLLTGVILLTIPVTFFVQFLDPYVQKILEISSVDRGLSSINNFITSTINIIGQFIDDYINVQVILESIAYLTGVFFIGFLGWKWWKKDIDFYYILRLLIFVIFISGAFWYIYTSLVLGESIY
ncbi:MAG: hypothetical protein GY828_06950 [Candidatus Gracilibacteria bacterium]|nr:hypothetical protein [Candidatus Gracilibacteria bacterium]